MDYVSRCRNVARVLGITLYSVIPGVGFYYHPGLGFVTDAVLQKIEQLIVAANREAA